jgi:hypothetical protein
MKTHLRSWGIALLIALTLGTPARAPDVLGVLNPYPTGTWTCVAVEVDLTEVSTLTGLEWFNNDRTVTFPQVTLLESDGTPPDLSAPGLDLQAVAGESADWSQLLLPQPVTSSTGRAWVVFRFPEGSSRTGEGTGTGPGLGYVSRPGDSGVLVTYDGLQWVSLAAGHTVALRPMTALSRAVPQTLRDLPRESGAPAAGLTPDDDGPDAALSVLVSGLHAPQPNPFNPRVEVRFALSAAGPTELAVYDVRGRRVVTLHRGTLGAGHHARIWEGVDDAGSTVASGVYFVKLSTETETFTQRMTLVR